MSDVGAPFVLASRASITLAIPDWTVGSRVIANPAASKATRLWWRGIATAGAAAFRYLLELFTTESDEPPLAIRSSQCRKTARSQLVHHCLNSCGCRAIAFALSM